MTEIEHHLTGSRQSSKDDALGTGALHGDLQRTSFLEIFKMAIATGKEATLMVANILEKRTLYFRKGKVRLLAPQRGRKRLGERLVHAGLISAQQLHQALQEQRQHYQPLGRVLVEQGFTTEEDIHEVAGYQAVEDLYCMFAWRRGSFEFVSSLPTDPELLAKIAVLPEFSCEEILAEVVRRGREWERILEDLGSIDEIFVARLENTVGMVGKEAQILDALDGIHSISDLPAVTMLSAFDCARVVRELLVKGKVERAGPRQTIEKAELLLERGETQRSAAMLQTLLERGDGNGLETVLRLAPLLQRCGEPHLAEEALLAASRQCRDFARALEFARQACGFDTCSVPALQRLRELLQEGGGKPGEWFEVSLRLADELVEQGRLPDARRVLGELKSTEDSGIDVLRREAHVLERLDRCGEALEVLLELAKLIEVDGSADLLAGVYEQILGIDPTRKDIAKALKDLRVGGRYRHAKALGLVAVLLAVGLIGIPLYREHAAEQREDVLARSIGEKITAGALKAAGNLADAAIAELGEREALVRLRAHVRKAVAKRVTKNSRERRREIRHELDHAAELVGKGDLRPALAIYERLIASKLGQEEAGSVVRKRVTSLVIYLEELAAKLPPLVAAEPDPLLRVGQRQRILERLEQSFQERDRSYARQVLEMKGDPILQHLLAGPERQRLRVAALEVDRSFTLAEQRVRKHLAMQRLAPLLASALEHGKQLAFTKALADYRRLVAEHPDQGSFKEQLRAQVRRYEKIVGSLAAIEKARRERAFELARSRLRALIAREPEIPFTHITALPMRVESRPAGARVSVNGESRGVTPLATFYLPEGRTRVRLELDGFEAVETSFEGDRLGQVRMNLVKKADWTFEASGSIQQPPVCDGQDRAFVVDRAGVVSAIQLVTGKLLWRFSSDDMSGLLPTPVIFGRTVIVCSVDGKVRALTRDSGKLVWQRDGMPAEGAPAIVGRTLLVGTASGKLFGLDAASGKVRYTKVLPGPVGSRIRAAGKLAFLVTGNGAALCFRAADGAKVWSRQLEQSIAVSPGVGGGMVLIALDEGDLLALRLADGRTVWRRSDLGNLEASPLVAGKRVLLVHGNDLLGHDLLHGRAGSSYHGPATLTSDPVLAGGKLFVGDEDGRVVVLDPVTLKPRYLLRGPGRVTAPVVVSPKGRFLLGFEGRRLQGYLRLP